MKRLILLLILLLPLIGAAQELFPLSEPASTIPKNAIGIRLFSETYKEVRQWRNETGFRIMYGAGAKISVYLTALASNHHGEKMPVEFPFHNTPERGKFYPYKFNGFHLYSKYRFLSLDGPHRHFRVAAYGEAAYVKATHHETEPDLAMGDNSGVGFGLIATLLKNRFALSLTAGMILPANYIGVSPDPVKGLPDVPIRVHYGKSLIYSLSVGYLLYPRTYKNYEQGNVNLYLEFRGKAFEAAKVDLFVGMPNEYYLKNQLYPPALQRNYYVDISPGIQYIYRSNLRFDFSMTFRGLGFSYARLYPVYTIGIQRYFYL